MSELLPNKDNKDSYDDISDMVRGFCAERLYALEKGLRPWVDGSFGDILPGHLSGYIALLRELGRLYQVHKPPAAAQDSIPAGQVQLMLDAARLEAEARMAAAVLEVELRVRAELQQEATRSIESAKQTALTKLQQLGRRG